MAAYADGAALGGSAAVYRDPAAIAFGLYMELVRPGLLDRLFSGARRPAGIFKRH